MTIGATGSWAGLNASYTYNNRLQPQEIKASSTWGMAIDLTYSFVDPSTTKNAGHVYSIANNLNASRSQNFTYDQLNRIASAGTVGTTGTTCWGYQYSYDAWANLLSQAAWSPNYNGCTQTNMAPVTADANNHISGLTYDPSGNTLTDGVNTYVWDGESQLKSAGGVNYLYDGDGRRVAKVGTKLYWYGSGGETLAETDASGNNADEYIYFGGRRVAKQNPNQGTTQYLEDMLGTSRVVTQSTGVCYDADMTPFGGERAYTDSCPPTFKFEGKERDTETGNDDFGARYYSNRLGRWLSSDWSAIPVAVPYANLSNPQTLNLYAMVSDDPESFADLDGHCTPQTPCTSADVPAPAKQDLTQQAIGLGKQMVNDALGSMAALAGLQFTPATLDNADQKAGANLAPVVETAAPVMAGELIATRAVLTIQEVDTVATGTMREITVDGSKYPESAGHIADAQAAGHPDVVTMDRDGASARRAEALRGTQSTPGMDRDEYPPAFSREGGSGASVRSIPPSDNRGAGASMGNQARNVPNGAKVRIVPIIPKPD